MSRKARLEKLEREIKARERVYSFSDVEEIMKLPPEEEILYDNSEFLRFVAEVRGTEFKGDRPPRRVKAKEIQALIGFLEAARRRVRFIP